MKHSSNIMIDEYNRTELHAGMLWVGYIFVKHIFHYVLSEECETRITFSVHNNHTPESGEK